MIEQLETKVSSPGVGNQLSNAQDIHNHILDLKNTLLREKMDYHVSRLILWCMVLERKGLFVYMLIFTVF